MKVIKITPWGNLIDIQFSQFLFPFMDGLKQEWIFDCLAPRKKASGASGEKNAVVDRRG